MRLHYSASKNAVFIKTNVCVFVLEACLSKSSALCKQELIEESNVT
jgi:hypothetical protein